MKKLIALIGAVATAFGLYAAGSSYYATSFEAGVDTGCTTEPLAFNLSEAGWTAGTTTETSIDLGTYESGEGYAYPTEGKGLRRWELFEGKKNNANYLKLETGSSSVGKTIGEGEVFIDQTVKFTGFEEVPAADAIDGQIAIWASAIEADDTVEPAIVGETNLYARVGTGTGIKDVKIAIDDFDLAKWYRLTIKSIGNVIKAGALSQAGFLVYVDGEPAAIVSKDQAYSDISTQFNDTATRYYTNGQLFTGIKTDSAAFTTVAFQGIGSIDDFVTSVDAPDFAAEVEFTVAAITGATIDKVVRMDGETEVELTAPYAVMPGTTVKVYFKAADGYRLEPAVATIVINEAGQINVSDQITAVEGYATLNGAIKGEAELAGMMANLKANDVVVFIKDGSVTNGVDETPIYTFATGTTITVADGAWALNVVNTDDGSAVFGIYADIANDITATFESADMISLGAGITIAAGKTLDASDENGSCVAEGVITVAGTLKGVNTDGFYAGSITLDGAGSVWSATQLTYEGAESIFTNEGVVEAGNAESGYTYALATEQPAFEPSATVADDLATAIAYLKNNYYNKYKNGDKVDAPDASFVKVGTLASDVTGTVSIGGTAANADEKFSLSIGNNAFLESAKFKIVGREVYVAAVILAIEQVKVTANAKDYQIDSAKSGNLELKSFAAVAPTTIAGEGTNFTIVRGDDKPLVKFFFTDTVTEYFVTKKTFIDKDKVATTSYGFTTPDEGGLWLYLGYGVGLGGNWNGVTYNYTVYAFGVDKKAITLSMSITDKAIQPPTPTYTVTFSTNTVAVAEKTLTDVKSGTKLAANQIPDFGEGTWDVQPLGAIITSNTNFNFTVKVDPIPPLPAEPTADDVNAKVDAAKFADSTVKTMIGGDPTKYNAFKTWAGTVTGGEAAVVASAHAADSYLLGQTTLLENAPVSEIKTIAKTSDTALTLTFEIKDGANAVMVAQTAADYVKGLVQCNEKVDFGNGTKIDATVTVTINGQTLTAAVTLPANKPAAFMKVATK